MKNKIAQSLISKINNFIVDVNSKRFPNNLWIKSNEVQIYVRKGYHVLDSEEIKICLDFATAEVPNKLKGKGIFTEVLDHFINNSPWEAIYAESVCNLRLVSFLCEKRGFNLCLGHDRYPEGTRSYFKKTN